MFVINVMHRLEDQVRDVCLLTEQLGKEFSWCGTNHVASANDAPNHHGHHAPANSQLLGRDCL